MDVYSSLRDAIYDSASYLFPSIPVIQAYTNGPLPSTTYLLFDILSLNAVGMPYTATQVRAEDDTQQTIQQYEVVVRYEWVGKQGADNDAANKAHDLDRSVLFPLVQEEFLKHNLSFMRKTPIRRIPKKHETDWYMCHQIDMTFAYQVVDIPVTPTIENVHIDGRLCGMVGEDNEGNVTEVCRETAINIDTVP